MSFQYPYQRILDLKEKETELAQIEYGSALHRLKLEESQLETLLSEKQRVTLMLEEMTTKSISAMQLIEVQQYLQHIEHVINQKKQEKGRVQQQADTALNQLVGRKKEQETWRILKEKRFNRYIEKQKKQEQNLMDELGSIKYSRDITGK
ncbi:MAG: flagellar export protein FliJ [Bacillaceae bacterium]|nr:flagellar export protein FliJ [Bacillaceae bacterium]